MNIIKLPNKILRTVSKDVKMPLNKKTIQEVEYMQEYIINSQKDDEKAGVGIAAIQLGIPKRMFHINIPNSEYNDTYINPQIISKSISYIALRNGEGCLSIDDSKNTEGIVKRRYKIILKAWSYKLKSEIELSLVSYPAIVFQHEIDHLNGKLFIDRINKKDKWYIDKNLQLI